MRKTVRVFFLSALLLNGLYGDSLSQDVELLKLEIEQLRVKMHSDKEEQSAINKRSRGVLELNGFDTVLSIGGRIQLNALLNSPGGSTFAGQIPLKSTDSGNDFRMDARDSRLWVKTRTPTVYGLMLTTLEIDFLGSRGTSTISSSVNSHHPRLRHVYVQLGGFGFGQTNSAFNSIAALETSVYPMDDTFVRQSVVRYTHNLENASYDISLEDPNTTLFASSDAKAPSPYENNSAPDVVLRARYYPSWGEVAVAHLSRLIKKEYKTDSKETQYAWATNLSGKILTLGLDDIRFNAHYGVGSGRYIGYNAFGAGVKNETTEAIDLTTAFGGHIGYRHWWSSSLRSTLALSYLGSKIKREHQKSFEFLTKESQALQFNLYWNPLVNLLVGGEITHAKRELYGEESAEIKSLNLVVRYDF